jgi:lipopolysaccharide export system permease protein
LISAVLVNVVAVVNQEVIAPRVGEELLRDPDDDGVRKVMVYSRYDVNGILIHGKDGDRGSQTVMEFSATIPSGVYGTAIGLDAKQARYIPEDASDAPMRGGWLVRGTTRTPADVPIDGEPRLVYLIDDEAMLKKFPPPTDKVPMNLSGDTYFLRTNISFDAVTRNRHWYQFASTPDLIRALSDPANEPERVEIEVALHTRLLRPLLALTLLVLSLPQVLGGDSRNMFVNLGLALGTSAIFYSALFLVQFVGNNGLISPELVAWGPLIGFGTVAAAGWDNIRT